jgi:GNAT superfamily N-acetyltransferase
MSAVPHLPSSGIRRLRDDAVAVAIVNEAAGAYRGAIPEDCWHDPYMTREELDAEIAAGVEFHCHEEAGHVLGIMGLQDVGDVTLVRHAYVLSARQRGGVGTGLLRSLLALAERPVLIGTWAAAHWAVAFYEKNGFALVSPAEKDRLLRTYWRISARQVETSVVLADARALREVVRPHAD